MPDPSKNSPTPPPNIEELVSNSWSKISPYWPLKSLVAVNPLSGFEDLNFSEALPKANAFFKLNKLPKEMLAVNRETIKWLQAYFDEEQSTFKIPHKSKGFLSCILDLLYFDKRSHLGDLQKLIWLKQLPRDPKVIISNTLNDLKISQEESTTFLTLMLTTLSGWSGYIQYEANWKETKKSKEAQQSIQSEYLALRLVLTYLIWPKANELLIYQKKSLDKNKSQKLLSRVKALEARFHKKLFQQLNFVNKDEKSTPPQAQFFFCIDVRSEPFRLALERRGEYETYGIAGFFGLPLSINNPITEESYTSCPVLIKPNYTINEGDILSHKSEQRRLLFNRSIKQIYQSLKHTFATPFTLVDLTGPFAGIWMTLKTLLPKTAYQLIKNLKKPSSCESSYHPDLLDLPHEEQVMYAFNALKMTGLTDQFAPLVIFCGHGSHTENNAFSSSLDCGACGGNKGASNARILAKILNTNSVRTSLIKRGIDIPIHTHFVAGYHNTTTDEMTLYEGESLHKHKHLIANLKHDLELARTDNNYIRCQKMSVNTQWSQANKETKIRSIDWAQVRPEWGLASNAAFIIGPRSLTKNIDLEGRSFLHSYDFHQDPDFTSLAQILDGPVLVTHWISSQYLFSTLDNITYGAGSKITHNITGKIGVMQGNASDLMHGLPLQSVYQTDHEPYHEPLRLTVVIYAPRSAIPPIIKSNNALKKIFMNQWAHLICYDPIETKRFKLKSDLSWVAIK